MIRPLPSLLALLLLATPLAGSAQSYWKWRDANGTVQISDQPPPNSVADKDILSRPGRRSVTVTTPPPEAEAPSAPKRDAELEARQRKLQAAQAASEAERAQAAKDKAQARREEQCRQARGQVGVLESGLRVVRPNAKGEPEYLDDKARAEEMRRAREQIANTCN